jgi:hypothetical protein
MKLEINTFGYILIGFVLIICLKIYFDSDNYNLKCIISNEDNNTYCVRETAKIQLVADLLARVTIKLKKISTYLGKKYPDRANCKRLFDNFNPKKIVEILPTSKYTAYSENKGEKLAFCTTKKKHGTELIDENTLTFVALHELAHIMTKTIGHNTEFWNNFKFLLQESVKIGIYKPVDYKKKSVSYCSMDLTDNPYFDM